jgi:tRNA (guanine37-N1)-methyltransferase
MISCIQVPKSDAQKAKNYLLENNFLNQEFRVLKNDLYIYFAVNKDYKGEWELVKKNLKTSIREEITAIPFKKALEKVLTKKELEIAKSAYDVIGSIAIIEIPDELLSKEIIIGESLLNSHPQISTVLRKDSIHEGVFRSQKMKFLAGEDTRIALYRENNCILLVDVEDVYFSARLSTERKRISEQINQDEEVLVMFSGLAPYPCAFAKNSLAKSIIGVEINPRGHELGLQNIKKNKVENKVSLFCGDVGDVVPKLNKVFDRIVMPLPKTAQEFLDIALAVAKPKAIIHLYAFYHEDEFYKATDEIKKYCKQANKEYEIIEIVKCGQHAPRTYRICVDIRLLN